MITKTHSFRILVLWITLWTMKQNDSEKEQEGRTTPNHHEGWHFLYWDDYPNFDADE